MSGREGKGKKRSKSYYLKCAHKKVKRGHSLDTGMKGFLVTCNANEKQAVRETYNLLNDYGERMYGPEKLPQNSEDVEESSGDESDEEEDIDAAMSKEVKAMKEVKVTERRFQNVNTKSRNTIFIKTLVDNPCDLTHQILSDIMESGVQKSRFAIRMLPIENICKARMNDMEECGKELFKRYFETPLGTGLSYTTQFTRRNNTDISREHAIPRLGQIVKDFNPLHRVNHKNPDYVILVEIIGSLCLMSVLKDFFKLKKYNLIEASKVKHSQGKSASEGTGLDDQHSTNVESTGENTPDLGVEGEKQAEIASSENNQIELTGNTSQQSPRKRKAPSLSKEDTVIVPSLPQNKTVVMETLDRSKTVVMETMPRSETVVMESMPRSETVVMENVERKDSVMDALSGGESVMQMSVKLDSVMDVLPSGESVMENGDDDDELDLT